MGLKTSLIVEASAYDIARDVYIPKIVAAVTANRPKSYPWDDDSLNSIATLAALAVYKCGVIDPTYKLDNESPSSYEKGGSGPPMGSYTKVMLQWLISEIAASGVDYPGGLTNLITRALPSSMANYVTQYNENFKYMQGPEKNFSYFKSRDQFYSFMESEETQTFFESREGDLAKENSRVFYEDEDYTVIVPKTWQASKYFGKDTRWCTAWDDSSNYFNQFSRAGILLMCMSKHAIGKSYQLFASKDPQDEDQMAANHRDRFANLEIALADTALLEFLKKNFKDALAMSVKLWTDNLKESSPRDTERYHSDLEFAYLGGPDEEEEEEEEDVYRIRISRRVANPYRTPLTEGTVMPSCVVEIMAEKVQIVNGNDSTFDQIHTASFIVVTMPLQALDESCLQFKEVNFSAPGALVLSTWDLQDFIDDVRESLTDDDYFDEARLDSIADDLSTQISNQVNHGQDLAFDRLDLSRLAYVIFSPIVRDDGPRTNAETMANFFGARISGGTLAESNPGHPLLGTMAVGDDDREVAILYNEEKGDLSDAMDDPKFKARMSKWIYHPGAARKAGQKELEFSARKVAP